MFKKLARLPQAGHTAVASRRPGRADGLMVGLDGHASLSAGRAPWRDGQAFLPLRQREAPKAKFVATADLFMPYGPQ